MKKMSAVLVLVFLASAASADSGEVRFLLSSFSPLSDDDNWESAFGIDVEMVNWVSPAVGIAAAIGASQWSAREVELYDYYPDSGASVTASLNGDATICPIGVSVLLRPIKSCTAEVTLEVGVRYAMVNSDVYARYSIQDGAGTDYSEDRIRMEDGFYGLMAFDMAFPISQYARISIGAGYQFDIDKGDAQFEGASIGNNEFEASIVRLGFNARF